VSKKLLTIKCLLAFIILSFCIIGRSKSNWPILHWMMYSRREIGYPSPTFSAFRVRVATNVGNVYTFGPWHLIPKDRDIISKRVIKFSVTESNLEKRNAYRAYLVRLIKRAIPNEIPVSTQIWKQFWHVDPLALPPLDLKHPYKEELKVDFSSELFTDLSKDTR